MRQIVLLFLLLGSAPSGAAAQGGPPDFLEVGRTYTVISGSDSLSVEVVEVTETPWVRARVGDGEVWLNTRVLPIMREISREEAAQQHQARLDQVYAATMRADLRNLMTAQELHYGATGYRYAGDPAELQHFSPSDGVTLEIGSSDLEQGYWARARHEHTDVVCVVTLEDVEEVQSPASTPGQVACTEGSGR